jgi:hypothetical protein
MDTGETGFGFSAARRTGPPAGPGRPPDRAARRTGVAGPLLPPIGVKGPITPYAGRAMASAVLPLGRE